MTTESKPREFEIRFNGLYGQPGVVAMTDGELKSPSEIIHVIEKSYADQLQSELKAKDDLLEEFIDVASDVVGMEMRTYGRLSNTSGLGSSISILNSFIEKLREGNK